MNFDSNKLPFFEYLLRLPLYSIRLAVTGYMSSIKGWLILSIILLSLVSYYFLEFINSLIPHLLGENLSNINLSAMDAISQKYSMGSKRLLPPLIDFNMVSRSAISVVYPSLFLLISLGLKNRNQSILCFLSTYICLLVLLVLKNYFNFQIIFADQEGVYLLFAISYYFSIYYTFGLILSNVTFSKLNMGLTGLIFTVSYLTGFVLLYHIFSGSTVFYDVLITYSFAAIIINYYLLRNKLLKSGAIGSINNALGSLFTDVVINDFKYEVFISYRRSKNEDTARLIRTAMHSKAIKAFLDIEDLGSRHFDEQLIRVIHNTENFVLLISPGDLNNCTEKNDWLRKEISTALEFKRNIIPILKDGFNWNELSGLPSDISDLPRHQSIRYSTEYFDAMLVKIISFMEPSAVHKPIQT